MERREAELREAMKLRHSLTTLLHALRVDMEQVSRKEGELFDEELIHEPPSGRCASNGIQKNQKNMCWLSRNRF